MWVKWIYLAMGCMVMAMQALVDEEHDLLSSDEDKEFKKLEEDSNEKSD